MRVQGLGSAEQGLSYAGLSLEVAIKADLNSAEAKTPDVMDPVDTAVLRELLSKTVNAPKAAHIIIRKKSNVLSGDIGEKFRKGELKFENMEAPQVWTTFHHRPGKMLGDLMNAKTDEKPKTHNEAKRENDGRTRIGVNTIKTLVRCP